MTIVGGEERARRAREVLAETMEQYGGDARLSCAADIRKDVGNEYWEVPIRAMLTFAAEASGIGEFREAVGSAFSAGWEAGFFQGTWKGAPGVETRSIADDWETYVADIDRSGLAQDVERCEYCGDTGDVHRTDGEWLGECTCGRAVPQSS